MKTLKLAALALTFGLFAASCGNSTTTEEVKTDSTAVTAQPETPATPPATATTTDTTVKTTTTDTTVKAAPAK